MKHIKDILGKVIKPITKKHRFSVQLIMNWEEVIGRKFSLLCKPLKVFRHQGINSIGVLSIAVNPGYSLLVMHSKDIIIDKINTYLGYEAIHEIKIIQKPIKIINNFNINIVNTDADLNYNKQLAQNPEDRLKVALQELKYLINKNYGK